MCGSGAENGKENGVVASLLLVTRTEQQEEDGSAAQKRLAAEGARVRLELHEPSISCNHEADRVPLIAASTHPSRVACHPAPRLRLWIQRCYGAARIDSCLFGTWDVRNGVSDDLQEPEGGHEEHGIQRRAEENF